VYSYGILLWEMMSAGMIPYDDMNPLQAAVAVVQKGLRPAVPPKTSALFAKLMQQCWLTVPESRPKFQTIVQALTAEAQTTTDAPIQSENSFLRKFKFGSTTKKQ
jgi:serine/threonine-protein kinase TNNI3K